jgi:hypothetical protein
MTRYSMLRGLVARYALVFSFCIAASACASAEMRSLNPIDRDGWSKLRPAVARILPKSGVWTQPLTEDHMLCPSYATVQPSSHIDFVLRPGRPPQEHRQVCNFRLVTTEGTLGLPTEELEAAMAHELGHLTLGHAVARENELFAICEKRMLVTDCLLTPEVMFRPYGPEQEKAADRYAAGLLRQVASSGCGSLVVLLRRLNARSEKLLTNAHPVTEERLQAVVIQCG